ncbi:MAG: hypothetical protein WA172_12650 [Terriglobales bacterium]
MTPLCTPSPPIGRYTLVCGGWSRPEFSVAVLNTIFIRAIDYSDSLLADKYTRYISIRVMNRAASLDLLAYEDPVFYDRLERTRVQATDRLVMIQAVGRLVQQAITTVYHSLRLNHDSRAWKPKTTFTLRNRKRLPLRARCRQVRRNSRAPWHGHQGNGSPATFIIVTRN